MNPVRIEGATLALGKPADWDEATSGHCSTLFIRKDIDAGVPFLRSAWEATPDEALMLLAGAKVQLGLCLPQHPVVNLGLGPLPDEFLPPMIVEQTVHHGQRAVKVQMLFPVGQRVMAQAMVGDDGLGAAVALAISEVERFARGEGWLE